MPFGSYRRFGYVTAAGATCRASWSEDVAAVTHYFFESSIIFWTPCGRVLINAQIAVSAGAKENGQDHGQNN
jgi:hypothetical protein